MNKRFNMKKRKGFTLIELVMVVAVLGVLSSIAMVKYTDISKSSKESSDYISAGNIATATKLALSEGKKVTSVKDLVDMKYLEGNPKVQSVEDDDGFELTTDGEIKVTAGNKKHVFYPKSPRVEGEGSQSVE